MVRLYDDLSSMTPAELGELHPCLSSQSFRDAIEYLEVISEHLCTFKGTYKQEHRDKEYIAQLKEYEKRG